MYKALQVLDTENKGYYTKDDLVKLMTSEGMLLNKIVFRFQKFYLILLKKIKGEPFNQEEMNEMLQTCMTFADPQSPSNDPHILYKYYINELVVEENEKN